MLPAVVTGAIVIVVVSTIVAFLSGMDVRRRILLNLAITGIAVVVTYAIGLAAKSALGISGLGRPRVLVALPVVVEAHELRGRRAALGHEAHPELGHVHDREGVLRERSEPPLRPALALVDERPTLQRDAAAP